MNSTTSRRDFLAATGSTVLAAAASAATGPLTTYGPAKPMRIGVISATMGGRPHKGNVHTYHFAHG